MGYGKSPPPIAALAADLVSSRCCAARTTARLACRAGSSRARPARPHARMRALRRCRAARALGGASAARLSPGLPSVRSLDQVAAGIAADGGWDLIMAIGDAFLPPDFSSSRATAAATSAQCSLYQRLRKSHGNRAGALAWLLVRLAQPDHREHEEACEAVMAQSPADLTALLAVVRVACGAARAPGARDILVAISTVLETAFASATLQERARTTRGSST